MPSDGSGAPDPPVSRLLCSGCGGEVGSAEPFPFRCPNAGRDDRDHVLARVLDLGRADPGGAALRGADPNPFLRYRSYFHAYHAAQARGLGESDYRDIVANLDRAVAAIEGPGFSVTPFAESPGLAGALGVDRLLVKDETSNVAGSHKARHLAGVLVWLAIRDRGGAASRNRSLAVASCGNAALAAAVLACADRRRLDVYVPADADPEVVARLASLGASLHVCRRRAGERGDPCYHGLRRAVEAGALPFTCQGNENGLVLDGGETLALEMAQALAAEGRALDRLFVQVGGGALASACIRGFEEAVAVGALGRMPRIHAVQTEGVHPLVPAYEQVVSEVIRRHHRAGGGAVAEGEDARAVFLRDEVEPHAVAGALGHAATCRSVFMRPWPVTPRSLAAAILDDETYDWFAIVRGMLGTGGYPVVVAEETLAEARRLALEHTGLPVCVTGSAGLAGALTLARGGTLERRESIAVLFTGRQRA
jgi:threonine synthase